MGSNSYSKGGPFTGGSGGGGVRSPDKPIADAGLRRMQRGFIPLCASFLSSRRSNSTKRPHDGGAQEVPRMSFLKFMANPVGRGVRIVAGIAIAAVGLLMVGHALGIALAAVGIVVFLAGALDFCIFAPIAASPLRGRDLTQTGEWLTGERCCNPLAKRACRVGDPARHPRGGPRIPLAIPHRSVREASLSRGSQAHSIERGGAAVAARRGGGH